MHIHTHTHTHTHATDASVHTDSNKMPAHLPTGSTKTATPFPTNGIAQKSACKNHNSNGYHMCKLSLASNSRMKQNNQAAIQRRLSINGVVAQKMVVGVGWGRVPPSPRVMWDLVQNGCMELFLEKRMSRFLIHNVHRRWMKVVPYKQCHVHKMWVYRKLFVEDPHTPPHRQPINNWEMYMNESKTRALKKTSRLVWSSSSQLPYGASICDLKSVGGASRTTARPRATLVTGNAQ